MLAECSNVMRVRRGDHDGRGSSLRRRCDPVNHFPAALTGISIAVKFTDCQSARKLGRNATDRSVMVCWLVAPSLGT